MLSHRLVMLGMLVLCVAGAGPFAGNAHAAAVYTFEGLNDGTLTNQDGWGAYLMYTGFNVLDATDTGINTSKVALAPGSPNFSVRKNDLNWYFTPHTGSIATMQFDLRFMPGTNVDRNNSGVYFGLAADVDLTAGITNTSERGPAFGILLSQFGIQHLGSSVGFATLGRPDDDFGVEEGDWLRLQMVIDRTVSADGLATLQFMNLTQGDTEWTQINSTPVSLGLTTRYADDYAVLQDPANWDTMMIVRAFSVGLQVDNLAPNAATIPEPSSLMLALLGLLGFGLVGRRR